MEQLIVNGPGLAGSVQLAVGRLIPVSPNVAITFGQFFNDLFKAGAPDSSRMIKVENNRNKTGSLAGDKAMSSSSDQAAENTASREVNADSAPVPIEKKTVDTTSKVDETENGISQDAQPTDETSTTLPGQDGKTVQPQQQADPDTVAGEQPQVENELAMIAAPELVTQMTAVAQVPQTIDTAAQAGDTENGEQVSTPLPPPATLAGGTESGEQTSARIFLSTTPGDVNVPALEPPAPALDTAEVANKIPEKGTERSETKQGVNNPAPILPVTSTETALAGTPSADVENARLTGGRLQLAQSTGEPSVGTAEQQPVAEAPSDMRITTLAASQSDDSTSAFVPVDKPTRVEQTTLAGSAGRDEAGKVSGVSGLSGPAKATEVEGNIVAPKVAQGANQPEMIDRIAAAMKAAMRSGQQRLRMDLHPPNLGSLRIDLVLREGVLSISMRTDTSAARSLILSHVDLLKESLERQDVQVGSFNVTTSGDGSPGFFRPFELHDGTAMPGTTWRDNDRTAEIAPQNTGAARRLSLRRQLVDLVA